MSYILKVVFFILIFSGTANGCMVPGFGPYYDQLLKVSEIEGKNRFKVELPRGVDDLHLHYVSLEYFESDTLNSEVPIHTENYQDLYVYTYYEQFLDWITFFTRKKFQIEFEAKYIENQAPIVSVYWWPSSCCMCSASGRSQPLKVEP